MKTLALTTVLATVAGVALVAVAACGGSSEKQPAAQQASPETSTTPANTATATASPTASPTPSPTPYNGKIARFTFPKFGIDAPIEELAINGAGELDTPKAENTAVGWYHIYDKPGRVNPDNGAWLQFANLQKLPTKGNSVFSAHVYYRSIPAPFNRLAQSQPGDEVVVVMEDGRRYTYKVISNQRYHRDTIPMGEIIWPKNKPADKEWLTMITCGGQLDSSGQEYVSRDVVIAEMVE